MHRLFLLLFIFIGICFSAQGERTTFYFKNLDWKVTSAENPLIDFEKVEGKKLSGLNTLKETESIVTIINVEDFEYTQASLFLFGAIKPKTILLNNSLLSKSINEGAFTDISAFIENGSITLKLNFKAEANKNEIKSFLEFSQINLVKDIAINHFKVVPDPNFGGSMLEVSIQNFTDKDIDGKVIVEIIDLETWDLVAENNNCAFSREGSLITIEVNFPENEEVLKNKSFMVKAIMVDKERNEEQMDELRLPISF